MEEVKNALRSLAQKICVDIQTLEIPIQPVWTIDTPTDGPTRVVPDLSRPAYNLLRSKLSESLPHMPEYTLTAAAIESDVEFGQGITVDLAGILHRPDSGNVRRLVTNFLWLYLQGGRRLEWNEDGFEHAYEQLATEIRSRKIVFHHVIPLSSLTMETDSLNFSDELTLEPASLEELEKWLNPYPPGPLVKGARQQWEFDYVDRPAVLDARQQIVGQPVTPPRISGEFPSIPTLELPQVDYSSVITAIRLVLNAPISVITRENRSEGLLAPGAQGIATPGSLPPRFPAVTLDDEKAKQVFQVWRALRSSPNTDLLRLPVSRWESSLLRQNREDKLIDCWISLESLLLSGTKDELSYRVALRLAEFLGENGSERSSIYKDARISYEWRSAIVHGSSSKKLEKKQRLGDAVRITSETLRLTLLKVLTLTSKFDPNKLESELLSRDI